MLVNLIHNSFSIRGGAEYCVNYHAERLRQLGSQVKVTTGDAHGIRTYDKSQGKILKLREHLLDIIGFGNHSLIQEVYNLNPDIVHIHNWARLRSRTISKLSKKFKTYMTIHDYFIVDPSGILRKDYDSLSRYLIRIRAFVLMKRFKRVHFIFPSERTASLFFSYVPLRPIRYSVIPLEIEYESAVTEKAQKDLTKLGFLGLLEPHKGILDVIEHFSSRTANNSLELLVAGSGSCFEQIAINKPDNVTMLGWLSELDQKSFFKRISWLLFPSIWPENFSITCSKALCYGIPIIANEIAFPTMALPQAVITYGDNSSYKTLEEALNFVANCQPHEYETFKLAALESAKQFNKRIDWNFVYNSTFEQRIRTIYVE